ncbi:MAG TPA: radical SAM/SPASM domain-containing protein, partial [Planctomycetota bacterium]|nr:radical SAM/SPASM domain-containing protein [Planctomycetota bacterium]
MSQHPTPEQRPRPRPKHEGELENFVALTLDLAEGRLEWRSRPYYLEYSTNSACNLRCIMCSQVEDPAVVSTPLARQEPFLEEVLAHTTLWTPSATSEPLLNNFKRLGPLIAKHDVWLDIITNAMLLEPEVLEALLPRLHRLTLSIDSHDKAVFEKLRAPAVFETVVEHSRYAIRRCREESVPVVLHMVLAVDVLADLEGYVDFVAELGGTRITVLELLPNSPRFAELDPFGQLGEAAVAERLEAMRRRCEERGVGVLFEVHAPLGAEHDYAGAATRVTSGAVLELMHSKLAEQRQGFCPMVMHYLKVEPDGRAYPCCRAPRELELGNVLEQGVEAVWNGAPMQELRRRMFAGDYPTPCRGCVVLEAPRWRAE